MRNTRLPSEPEDEVRRLHTVVYLDQNYLSNITKAITGNINNITTVRIWGSVFDDIEKAVLAYKIACPMEEPIRQTIDKLSMGLRFRQNQRILEKQIEDAAYNFLGKKHYRNELWVNSIPITNDISLALCVNMER